MEIILLAELHSAEVHPERVAELNTYPVRVEGRVQVVTHAQNKGPSIYYLTNKFRLTPPFLTDPHQIIVFVPPHAAATPPQ